MTTLDAWKSEQGRVWVSAPWQNIVERELFRVHDELVARLKPQCGERWLDLATGTGAVAQRESLHRDWVACFERHRSADGINAPRPYQLAIGLRK